MSKYRHFPAPHNIEHIPDVTEYQTDEATGGVLIPLGGKKYPGLFAIVDVGDVALVATYQWRPISTNGTRGHREILYAVTRTPEGMHPYMHRLVMGVTDRGIRVDHENRNGLDNRRANLRVATALQNRQNSRPDSGSSSQYKGVYWNKKYRKWQAAICVNGTNRRLGRFDDESDAGRAYDAAARDLFGEYAYLNFPDQMEREAA